MQKSDSKKLDHIVTMLGDMVAAFGKRFDRIDDTLEQHTALHNDHTRRLNTIENDVNTNLDKRLQLEVRTGKIEKHLGLDKKIAA